MATKTSGASIGSIESGPSLGAYYNASQLRADTWSRLKVLTGRLEHHDGSSAAPAKLRAQAEAAGQEMIAYAAALLERAAKQPPLEEILAPVRAEFAASGMTDDQLGDYLEEAKHEMRRDRRQDPKP